MRKIVAIFVLCVFAAAHGVTAEQSLFASLHTIQTHNTNTASTTDAALNDIQPETLAVPSDQNYPASAPEECCDSSVSSKSAVTHCTVDCMVALASYGPDFQESSQSTSGNSDTLDSAPPPATLFRPPIG